MSVADVDEPVERLDQLLLDMSILLLEPCFGQAERETTSLRAQMSDLLTDLRTYKLGLQEARGANEFGDDPMLAGRIHKLQGGIARIRTTVDLSWCHGCAFSTTRWRKPGQRPKIRDLAS
jgi:hypothetical protein